MKRLGLFWLILLLVIAAFYMEPVLFPPKLEVKENSDQQISNQMTTWKYQELKATGFSTYIGKPIEQLEKDFGQSYDRLTSGFGFETRYYENKASHLTFEVNVQDSMVTTVKVLQTGPADITPFYLGMTMQDLTKLTTIYTNFTFEYHDTEVGIELMEEDMNYRPLIAFDNDTFAILFFDQTTNGLFSVVYLDKDSLLKLLPYQVFGEGLPHYEADKSADWESINRGKERKSTTLLNMLRREDELPIYNQPLAFQSHSRLLLHDFLTKPEEILSDERMADWQKSLGSAQTTVKFSLTNDELEKLISKQKLENTSGLFIHPAIDATFSFLYWYSDPYNHDRFMDPGTDSVGIAFSKENMLVLLQEENGESSDSSDR